MTASRLPTPLPDDPLPLVRAWLGDAARDGGQRNHGAMAIATADASGRPSVRMVLLKAISVEHGYAVFYTHRRSRKGRELDANPRAAGVLYWERLGRQLRLEGRTAVSPDAESDAYFDTRPLGSRINAWVSAQSEPLDTLAELHRRAQAKTLEHAASKRLPRPPFWGGYRLWLDAIELWVEGEDRFHERVRYERELGEDPAASAPGAWRRMLLQP